MTPALWDSTLTEAARIIDCDDRVDIDMKPRLIAAAALAGIISACPAWPAHPLDEHDSYRPFGAGPLTCGNFARALDGLDPRDKDSPKVTFTNYKRFVNGWQQIVKIRLPQLFASAASFAATVHCATPTSIVVGAPAPATTIANDATMRRAEASANRAELAAGGGNKDADVVIENMKTYASNCAEAYFRTKSGTFKTLALVSGGLGECQFLTLNNTMPGTVADKKIMDRYIEINDLPRAERDKEIDKEPAITIGAMFGVRDAVTDIFWAELAKHCTHLGGKNETSEVSCK
jgi:hypothetical protein